MAIILPFRRGGGEPPSNEPPDQEPPAEESPKNTVNNVLRRRVIGIGGALILAGVTGSALYFSSPHVKPPVERPLTGSISTVKGETQCFELPDSSEICLRTATKIDFMFSRYARNVEVLSGEASFNIQHGSRPFEVRSGGLAVRDVGTRFDVLKKEGLSVLTVIDGRVKAKAAVDSLSRQQFVHAEATPEKSWDAALEYHDRQQLEFDEASKKLHEPRTLSERDLHRFLAWQRGQIDLNGKRLRAVFDEVAQYQSIVDFDVPDSLNQLTLDGILENPTDLFGFLNFLSDSKGITYTLSRGADGQTVVNLLPASNMRRHAK